MPTRMRSIRTTKHTNPPNQLPPPIIPPKLYPYPNMSLLYTQVEIKGGEKSDEKLTGQEARLANSQKKRHDIQLFLFVHC